MIQTPPFLYDDEFDTRLAAIAGHLSSNPKQLAKGREQFFTVKNTDNSHRTINNWAEKGIIDDNRTHDKEWRKFSATDLAWIYIVNELRDWNFGLDVIKGIKDTLYTPDFCGAKGVFAIDVLLTLALLPSQNYNLYLIVFSDGRSFIANKKTIELNQIMKTLNNSLLEINLTRVWQTVWPQTKVHTDNSFVLSNSELEVLKELRLGKTEKISIKRKGRQLDIIELETQSNGENPQWGTVTEIFEAGHSVGKKITDRRKI